MKLKLTVRRSGSADADVLCTVDGNTHIGDLARFLDEAHPDVQRGAVAIVHGPRTLRRVDADVVYDPAVKVADSGLLSGMPVAVTDAHSHPGFQAAAVAVVSVVSGPDMGRSFNASTTDILVGRDPSCDVTLSDPQVSRRHARIRIGSPAGVVDIGSANGTEVNGVPIQGREVLHTGDVIRVGDTVLTVRVAAGSGASDTSEGFVRSPRLDPRYEGEKLTAPEPPAKPDPARFPVIAIAAPVVTGLLLFLLTRSTTSLLFVAVSPLMMLGYAVEATLAGKSAYKKAMKVFEHDVAELTAQAERTAAVEIAARMAESPSLGECLDAADRTTVLLWSRRPEERGFAEVRLGVGPQAARMTIALPERRDRPRDQMARLTRLAQRFSVVQPVPVVANLGEQGAIGVAGSRANALAAGRALVAQIVSLHSPAELVLTAFASAQSAVDWSWLSWLPHTTSMHSPLKQNHLAAGLTEGISLVSALEDLLQQRADSPAGTASLPAVLAIVEDDATVERSRLVDLAERGWRHGIHVLWIAEHTTRLPAACRAYLHVGAAGTTGEVGFVHSGELITTVAVELLDPQSATSFARRMAPMVDIGARADDESDLPRSVSLLAIAETPTVAVSPAVIERWQENRSILTGPYAPARPHKKAGTLRATIGVSALGPHVLDLREHGPHALVGGTTGSGKSELLQSWILAMATEHSPQRLTFLLIDYKGGSAFGELENLPHTVGLFTDLNPYAVRRALTSLNAELKRREELFARHKAKDLIELEKAGVVEAPPSLVIVVDEFAALVTELPEFVSGMINIAQRGRSLGVHLILATQRPGGVIKDDLRANTNLRLALRTADEAGSTDILDSPQAAFFDSAVPGRAVSKTGPGRLVPFQTGYAGGWTSDTPPPPQIVVEDLGFGGHRIWERAAGEADEQPFDLGPTDITRLVRAIRQARADAGMRLPVKPWRPMLAAIYDLTDPEQVLNRRRDHELIFGIEDVPEQQVQQTVAFRPDEHANLAVIGTGGSGKTTLLRTLAVAAGTTIRGGPCHVYGLDFAGRGLAMLETLPHVASIVAATESERVFYLITWLHSLVEEREARYAATGAGTIVEYRAASGAADEPRILLLIDGIAAFRSAYELGERGKLFDAVCAIAGKGRQVGVHVLLTADRAQSIPTQLAAAVQTRIVLRMADPDEYGQMNVPADVLSASSPPGRGLLNGVEIQVAILGKEPDVAAQVANLTKFGQAMLRAGIKPVKPIARLSDEIPLDSLESIMDGLPVLGLGARTLAPVTFVPEGGFLLTGPPGSGRTTALRSMAWALHRWNPRTRIHLFAPGRSSLTALDLWASRTATSDPNAAQAVKQLMADLQASTGPAAVFVEALTDIPSDHGLDVALLDLVRYCMSERFFVVAEAEVSAITSMSDLANAVRAHRYGLNLVPNPNDGDRLYRTPFPSQLPRSEYPDGRGLLIRSGRLTQVQVGWTPNSGA